MRNGKLKYSLCHLTCKQYNLSFDFISLSSVRVIIFSVIEPKINVVVFFCIRFNWGVNVWFNSLSHCSHTQYFLFVFFFFECLYWVVSIVCFLLFENRRMNVETIFFLQIFFLLIWIFNTKHSTFTNKSVHIHTAKIINCLAKKNKTKRKEFITNKNSKKFFSALYTKGQTLFLSQNWNEVIWTIQIWNGTNEKLQWNLNEKKQNKNNNNTKHRSKRRSFYY